MDKPFGDATAAKTQEGLWKSFLTTMLLFRGATWPLAEANSAAEGNVVYCEGDTGDLGVPEQEQVPWRRGKERPGALLAQGSASSPMTRPSHSTLF